MVTLQRAILTDCQSLGRDYYNVTPQHLPQFVVILEFTWHEIELIWNPSVFIESTKKLWQSNLQWNRADSPNLQRGEVEGFSRVLITRHVLKFSFHNAWLRLSLCIWTFGITRSLKQTPSLTWLVSFCFQTIAHICYNSDWKYITFSSKLQNCR